MSMDEIGTVDHLDKDSLIRSVARNRGQYAFLIGAGTSIRAGIPLASQLTDEWKNKVYVEQTLGLEVECDEPDWRKYEDEFDDDDPEFHEWVNDYRKKNMKKNQNEYGFWFSECYPTREERRFHIHEKVADAHVTFGNIMLAGLMTADPPYISHVLTPNFDNLLFNAFYEYFDVRPYQLNHNELMGPEFKLTEPQPTIIKLHGDYLYSNLQNTAFETSTLQENMRIALQRTLREYGLVVVGYSGRDNSIMDVLTSEDFSIPEPGLFWCARSPTNLSQNVECLLQRPNTYLVKIDGFESLMGDFYTKVRHDEGFLFPRAKELENRMRKLSNKVVSEVDNFRDRHNSLENNESSSIDSNNAIKGLRDRLAGDYWLAEENENYAEECYMRAIENDFKDPMNFIALANFYNRPTIGFEQWVLAEDIFTVAMDIPCKETMARKNLKSLELNERVLDLNSVDIDGLDMYEIYNGRGIIRRRIAGMLMDLYTNMRGNDELDIDEYDDILRSLREKIEKKSHDALLDFKWAVDRAPDSHRPYVSKGIMCFRLAQFYEEVGELAKAKERYQMAQKSHNESIKRSFSEEMPHLNLAEVALRLKDFETTTKEAQTAADLSRKLSWFVLSKYFKLLGLHAQSQLSSLNPTKQNKLDTDMESLVDELDDLLEKEYEVTWVKKDIEKVMESVEDETPQTVDFEDYKGYLDDLFEGKTPRSTWNECLDAILTYIDHKDVDTNPFEEFLDTDDV